jgi:hypothetical protein
MAKLAVAGVLIAAAVALIVVDLQTEWNCSGPNPNSWFSVAGALLSGCAVLIALAPATLTAGGKRRWWYAVIGGVITGLVVFVPVAVWEILAAIGKCAN